jgi:ATP-binding cassette subfamily B protein
LLLAGVLSLAYSLLRLLEPWPIKLIIDNVLLGRELPGFLPQALAGQGDTRWSLLWLLAGTIIVLAVLRGLLYYRHRLLVALLGIQVTADLRLDLYRHLQQLSLSYHDRRRTGDLIVRLTSDIRMLRQAFISLPLELAQGLLLMAGMAAVMLIMDWRLALPALVLLPVVALLVRSYQRPMRQAIRKQREREGHLASLATESLNAIKMVQGFRGERHEVKRFGGANRKDMRSGLKASRFEAKLKWSADLSVSIITAIIILLATRQILVSDFSVGDLVVFLSYLKTFARPLQRVSRLTERMIRATAAGERVLTVLRTDSPVKDRTDAVPAPRLSGAIEFQGVTFAYGGRRPVLQDLSLTIRAGERVAIVGRTGAGKSTLASLIPRFYDPEHGTVRVDGRDVRELTLQSLRKQIALVFQEPLLMGTSIAENIAYGRPGCTMEQVVRAARRAQVHRIIERLPEGYDTVIGERGKTLSGGQRQCIAIARAMVRNAPILILDEPTVGLDGRASARVRRALQRVMQDRTVLLITHDMSDLDQLDRVIVVEDGTVRETRPPLEPAAAGSSWKKP